MRRRILVAVVPLLACGPTVQPSDGGQDGSDDGGTTVAGSTSAADSTGVGPTTAITTTTPTTSATSTTGSTDEGSTGEPASVCDPQPVEVTAWATVDWPVPGAPASMLFTGCDFVNLTADGDLHTISLVCNEGQPDVLVAFPYPLLLDPGPLYELAVWWPGATRGGDDIVLVLRETTGPLTVAAGVGPQLPGEGGIPADFTDPVGVERLGEVCPVEPHVETDFIGTCFDIEREALRITVEGETVDAYDGSVQLVGVQHAVAVQHAEERHDLICTDIPDRWYQWVVAPPIGR